MSKRVARAIIRQGHESDLAAGEAVEGQAGLVGEGGPRRLELGAEGEHGQDRVVRALGEELRQELQGGRVRPVQVLEDEQDRPVGGAHVQPLQHEPERLLSLPGR